LHQRIALMTEVSEADDFEQAFETYRRFGPK